MKHILVSILSMTLLSPMLGMASPQSEFEHSQWEFEISYSLIGVPQTFPIYKLSQCIDSSSPFPSINRPGNECKAQLQGEFGNTYTWSLDCSDDWEMVQGMGRIHFMGGEAHGDVHLQILNPHNPPQIMEFLFKGKAIGGCS